MSTATTSGKAFASLAGVSRSHRQAATERGSAAAGQRPSAGGSWLVSFRGRVRIADGDFVRINFGLDFGGRFYGGGTARQRDFAVAAH